MKKIYFHSLVLILLILQSCAFKQSGEEFVQLDPTGKLPNVEVNLNFATDTIYIQKNENLTFSYSLNGEQVNWAKFIMNGKETALLDGKSGSIQMSLYFDNASVGTFPLEMKIFTKSQTGSIADHVGTEGYLISRKWTIVVKNQNQMSSKITKAEFVDGSLKIDWDMFKGMDFKSYKLYKSMDYVQNTTVLVATINSQDQTSFVDNTYHGERSSYYVVTNDKFYGATFLMTGPLPVLSASNTISGDILLKWDKPGYYKNLKGYRISYRDTKGNMQIVGEITNNAIESYIIPNPIFGYNYDFYLTPLPVSDIFYPESTALVFLSSRATASYGVASPTYWLAQAGLAPVSYLINDLGEILVFDHQTFTTTRRIKYKETLYQIRVSANNKYLLTILNTPKYIYIEDLTDPTIGKKIDFSIAFPQKGPYATVSNVGTGVFANGHSAVLYDYINERKLAEISIIHDGSYANKIAPSGNFFYLETYSGYEYFQYKDNQIIRLPENIQTGDVVIHADYLPGNGEKLVRTLKDRVEVLDCNTWTIEKQWPSPIPNGELYNLDLKSGKLMMRENSKLILFDVMNGTREELINVGESSNMQWSFFYNDGQVLWGEGKALR